MDEVATLADAQAFGSGGLTAIANADHIAPLYSIIVWIVTIFNGDNELMVRMPSAIAGTLTVPVFYALGVRLFRSRAVGLISAALAAVSPFAIWYAQEARAYALLLLCACTYVVLAWPIVSRRLRTSELVWLLLVTAIGLYCHHYMILVSAAFGLFLLFSLGPTNARVWIWLTTQVIAFLPFVYWLTLTAHELRDHAGVAKPYLVGWVPYTLYTFVVGYSFGPSVRDFHMETALHILTEYAAPVCLVVAAMLVTGLAGLREVLRIETRQAGAWCIVWTAVPIGLAILATFVTNISYNVRYVIGSFPPVILCLAFAVEQVGRTITSALGSYATRRSRLRIGATPELSQVRRSLSLTHWVNALGVLVLVGCILASLHNLYFDDDYAKENVREAARFLRKNYTPSTLLIVDNIRVSPILAHYGVALPPGTIKVYDALDGQIPVSIAQQIGTLAGEPMREVWLLEYRSWESDPERSVKRQLDSQAMLTHEYVWSGISLRCYSTRPPT
jgi:4-amino-4-deoxy-L-arabinose transferase-like glycosyltransferase